MDGSQQLDRSLLSERDVARLLAVSVAALRKWRRQGFGPRFRKLGSAVRYHPADLDAWLNARVTGGGGSNEPRGTNR